MRERAGRETSRTGGRTWLGAGLALVLVWACAREEPAERPAPRAALSHVGREVCAGCHPDQTELWRGSHHDLAMQEAGPSTVSGSFGGATLSHFGVTSTFFRRDDRFFVRTEGASGELQEYEVAYTFGVSPLQQYLVEFPGGRLQALSLAWDTRPAERGGQRWFHLYPEERIPPGDPLHWTARAQNWNTMCAECHSTNLEKNYDLASDSYSTTWSEIDVSCEACHGPGSRHLAWAESDGTDEGGGGGHRGLVVSLGEEEPASWVMDMETGIATRSHPRRSHREVEACGRCHSRRTPLRHDYLHGRPLLDSHRVALLEEGLYWPDGQILDEVYVYGSFRQSKMYRAGVTCRDCHDPHDLRVRGEKDAVCATCHLPARFETRDHHFHPPGSAGASCVECHMPERTYMVVDPRRDHSLRVPRPELTVELGTPNACNGCHDERSAAWAAQVVERWYGGERMGRRHYGETLEAGRRGLGGALPDLVRLAEDPTTSAMVRATALTLFPRAPAARLAPSLELALDDDDPLVRSAALRALAELDPETRQRLAPRLLVDPVKGVRVEAARVLADLPSERLGPRGEDLEAALAEYRSVQLVNADRPEAHLNLGWLAARRGDLAAAEEAYRTALRLDAAYSPASVNLADLYRLQGRDERGEEVLRRGLELDPDDAHLHHSLGLLLVRRERRKEALEHLRRAAELLPGEPRYGYVYGIALYDAGQQTEGLAVLEAARQRHPADRELLLGLATLRRQRGELAEARRLAAELVELAPRDPAVRRLQEALQRE